MSKYINIEVGVKFNPKEDITTFELAKCVQFMDESKNERIYMSDIDRFGEPIKKHFNIWEKRPWNL